MTAQVTVLGAGAWGTALAIHLARRGADVCLWGHRKEHIEALAGSRMNSRYLPDVLLPGNLRLETDLGRALESARYVLIVVPSKAFRKTLETVAPLTDVPIFWATKGLDPDTGRPLHEPALAILGEDRGLGVLSGPSFAREVANGLPTAVTVAATDMSLARRFATLVHGKTFRAYVSTDLVGVELGGAAKNVIAIAAGISDGLGFGANARAGCGVAHLRTCPRRTCRRNYTSVCGRGSYGTSDEIRALTRRRINPRSRERRKALAETPSPQRIEE